MTNLYEWLVTCLMAFFVVVVMAIIIAVMSLSFEEYSELSDYAHKSTQSCKLK